MTNIVRRLFVATKSARVLLGIASLMLLLIGACGQDSEPEAVRLRPVRYLVVTDDSVARDRNFSGTAKSSRESRLSFKVGGTVTQTPVQIGQRLSKGDLIAELDSAAYLLQAQQAQASLVEAQANERQSNSNYERTKGLYANDNASLNDLESARAQAESATAVVASASKALEIAQLNASYTRLTADADCSIASMDVEVNENVAAGEQVAAVSCGDDFEVTLDLPESLINRIDRYTPVTIRFGSIPDFLFGGQITEVAVAIAPDAAAFPIVISINERHTSLRSGLTADVTFQLDSTAVNGGVVLPVAAVAKDPTGTFVFIAEPDAGSDEATIRRRDVTLGELTQSGVEVIDGVRRGDRVVTAGVSVIRDGQRVLLP